jgi:hypothetical protein
MAFCKANSWSRFIEGIGRDGGGTGGRNAPRQWVEDSGTSSYSLLPERVLTIYNKIVHTMRKRIN